MVPKPRYFIMARIPTPQKLALLHGDKNNRRSDPEPEPSELHPDCPQHLSREAQQHWCEVTANLDEMGLLSKTDADSIIIYVEAFARYRELEQFIRDNGSTYKLSNGCEMSRPEVNQMMKNLDICRRYQIEFGLTPAARSRVAIQKKNSSTGWGDFFD